MNPEEPPAAVHEFFCTELEAIEARENLRSAYSCPPGHAKTKFFTRMFPAWYLGKNPHDRYLQGGHSQSFVENEFGRYVRDIIMEPRYRDIFPHMKINKRNGSAAGSWRVAGQRGAYVAKGVGQSIAGYRGHIGGIDDPFALREDVQSPTIRKKVGDWLFTDFRTRLLPHSPLFIVATRWHPDDLIGRVEQMSRMNKGLHWRIVNLPAIIETEEQMATDALGRDLGEALWPEYYTVMELLELKATLPPGDWPALYMGQPRDPEGNVVKGVWFQRYDRLPANGFQMGSNSMVEGEQAFNQVRRITLSVDCAEKATSRANYSAITVWVEDMRGQHYLADVVRKKLEMIELVAEIKRVANKWSVGVILIEDGGAGTQILQQYTGKLPAPMVRIPTNNKSKSFRFDGVTPMFEAGEVLLPKTAPWLSDYEGELLSFPNGSDDQVDSTSQYLTWARRRAGYGSKKLKGLGHKR